MLSIFYGAALLLSSYLQLANGLGTACTGPLGGGTAAPSDPYWLETITKRGTSAFNANPAGYKVFRNVRDYGQYIRVFPIISR